MGAVVAPLGNSPAGYSLFQNNFYQLKYNEQVTK
jgi:hypothetical protein